MEIEKESVGDIFCEIAGQEDSEKSLTIGRFSIGNSPQCDIMVDDEGVSPIHAVLEIISTHKICIYDMNSEEGTWIDNKKIIFSPISIGQEIYLGKKTRIRLTQKIPHLPDIKEIKRASAKIKISPNDFYFSRDFDLQTKYIFENQDELYPIFKYDHSKLALEVVVNVSGNIFSINYLPFKNNDYYISSQREDLKTILLPTQVDQKSIKFLSVRDGSLYFYPQQALNFEIVTSDSSRYLQANEQVREDGYVRGNINNVDIWIRKVPAPPDTLLPKLYRKDALLMKVMSTVVAVFLPVALFLAFIHVDKVRMEEKKIEERITKIIYLDKHKKHKSQQLKSPVFGEDSLGHRSKKGTSPAPQSSTNNAVFSKDSKPVRQSRGQPKFNDSPNLNTKKIDIVERDVPSSAPSALDRIMKSSIARPNNAPIGTSQTGEANNTTGYSLKGSESGGQGGNNLGYDSSGHTGDNGTEVGDGFGDKKGIITARTAGVVTVELSGIDEKIVDELLKKHKSQFQYCYESDSENGNNMGKVQMNFLIGASGYVTTNDFQGNITTQTKSCFSRVLKSIYFPKRGQGQVEITKILYFSHPRK